MAPVPLAARALMILLALPWSFERSVHAITQNNLMVVWLLASFLDESQTTI
jgi:hypothetical protein